MKLKYKTMAFVAGKYGAWECIIDGNDGEIGRVRQAADGSWFFETYDMEVWFDRQRLADISEFLQQMQQ